MKVVIFGASGRLGDVSASPPRSSVADRLIVHVDLLDADPHTASVSLDRDVVSVTAAHRSGDRADAWYAQSLWLDRSLKPDRSARRCA
jgi:hypothetical protein